MKKLFAVSMGFVNRELKASFIIDKHSIYAKIIRCLAYEFLNSGARIYLPYPVELIEKEEEVYSIIAHCGYCLMSFEQNVSTAQVFLKSKSILRDYGLSILDTSDKDDLETFVECLSPYLISFTVDHDLSQSRLFEKTLEGLNEVIERGRQLPIHTRTFMAKLLEELHASKVIGLK